MLLSIMPPHASSIHGNSAGWLLLSNFWVKFCTSDTPAANKLGKLLGKCPSALFLLFTCFSQSGLMEMVELPGHGNY